MSSIKPMSSMFNSFNGVIKRDNQCKSLKELINEDKFLPPTTQDSVSDKPFRIPDYQRFYTWDIDRQNCLIDTVMVNFPCHAIILSQHAVIKDGSIDEFHNIEDGQQRLTTLHNYKYGKCDTKVLYEGKTYNELSASEKETFDTYQVPCQIISKNDKKVPNSVFENAMVTIFERLNQGKPLSDAEKFHARKNTPIVHFATKELPNYPILKHGFNAFIGPVGTGKSFRLFNNLPGVVLTIIRGTPECATTSFLRLCNKLNDQITHEEKQMVVNIMADWFRVLNFAYTGVNAIPNETVGKRFEKKYGLIGGPLGIFIRSKISPELCPNITDAQWAIYLPNSVGIYNDFILSDSDRRHLTGTSLTNRLIAMNAYFSPTNASASVSTSASSSTTTIHVSVTQNNGQNVLQKLQQHATLDTDDDSDSDGDENGDGR